MKSFALLLIACLMSACATTQAPPADTRGLMADALFGPPAEKITTADLFTVTPAMKEYLRSPAFQRLSAARGGGAYGLIDALYTPGELKLDYDSTATRSAGETFANKSGNCMSLVIMTAAFARELNLVPIFQNVQIADAWTRTGELYFSNMHVNLMLENLIDENTLVVDFLPSENAKNLRVRRISEAMVEAMYLNNRAAEALVANRLNDAYWWARKAVAEHPTYTQAINTLGVVYQRRGHNALAERAYRYALVQEPESYVALSNLMPLLAQAGRKEEAQALAARLSEIRKVAPFQYFRAGMEAMQREDYAVAREMFRKEVARDPYYDEFHYWLGVAQLRLGDARAARQQFALALETSSTAGSRNKYSSKLRHLKSTKGGDL